MKNFVFSNPEYMSVTTHYLKRGPAGWSEHRKTVDPAFEGQESLLRISADSLSVHVCLLHGYGIVLSNCNRQTFTRRLCRVREEETAWVIRDAP